jgi:hypothetical protein
MIIEGSLALGLRFFASTVTRGSIDILSSFLDVAGYLVCVFFANVMTGGLVAI